VLLDDLESIIRPGRKRALWRPEPTQRIDLTGPAVEELLPHRDPFLFVDAITALDVAGGRIQGRRRIDASDPVFRGHFPDYPVYPGVLQLETMGQLGLCLMALGGVEGTDATLARAPRRARAVKVHHAVFVDEVRPGDELEILAQVIAADDYVGICAGQLLKSGAVCAFGVMEVYFVDP
jgi:3-hydroxyacyl-[acyl-carrier-protein] dehydratase